VRTAAYVRERPPVDDAEPAFAQGERIRRWVTDHGHLLVAVCHDQPDLGAAAGTDPGPGFDALLAIVDAGLAEAVVVASLAAIGDDVTGQEIRVWELQRRGIAVRCVTPADDREVAAPEDEERRSVRALLSRLGPRHPG
jgi:DNA invertase Pin-like site-specific DNA recombinase